MARKKLEARAKYDLISYVDGQVIAVSPKSIVLSWNSRRANDDDSDGLTELIKKDGIVTMPTVRPIGGYDLVDKIGNGPLELVIGRRRLARAIAQNDKTITVRVRILNDLSAKVLNFTENTARTELQAWERAESLTEIQEKHGLSIVELSRQVGMSPEYVGALILVKKRAHPEIWKQIVKWGESCKIGWTQLAAIARLEPEEQLKEWQAKTDSEQKIFRRGKERKPGKAKLIHALCMIDNLPKSKDWIKGAEYALRFALGRAKWDWELARKNLENEKPK